MKHQAGNLEVKDFAEDDPIRRFAADICDRYWEQDAEHRFTFVSDQIEQGKDSLLDQSLGRTLWEVADIDPLNDLNWCSLLDALEQKKPFKDFLISFEQGNSDVSHWKFSGSPWFDSNGEFCGYRGIARDVTASIVAEQESKLFYSQLTNALESMSEGIALYDSNNYLLLCNQRYKEIFPEIADLLTPGVRFEDSVSIAFDRGIYEVEHDQKETFIKERLRKRYAANGEPFIIPFKGNKWIQIREGRTVDGGFVAVWTDITELKEREQQLYESQKIEALGQLTGGIAHDFNNFLAVVLGNLALLENRLEKDSPLLVFAEKATKGANRAAALTQRMLAFGRKQKLNPCPTDIPDLLDSMMELVRTSVGEGIEIKTDFQDGLSSVFVDPSHLETVILNLVLNARDAMSQGGVLEISAVNFKLDHAAKIGLDRLAAGRYVALSVADNGSGISEELRQKIFEPFFTTKDVGKGSGLGMSLIYGFVRQSSGSLAVESEEGKGTKVTLFLPLTELIPARRPAKEAKRANYFGDGETILVVEDDSDVREMVCNMLKSLNFNVVSAENKTEAEEAVSMHPEIKLLLSDVVLRGLDSGPDIAEYLREIKPDLSVVFMSGYTDLRKIRRLPSDQVKLLKKPFERFELGYCLRRALEKDA